MASRLELQSKLEELLGSMNVYYQSPSNGRMQYPAIKYSKKKIESRYANDATYSLLDCYEIIVIDPKPDNPVIKKLLQLPHCQYDRPYTADNLNHDVLTLYY
jgi:hypothetical protein